MPKSRRKPGRVGGPDVGYSISLGHSRSPRSKPYLLESGTLKSLRRNIAHGEEVRAFFAAYYGHLASQREEVRDKLTRALASTIELRTVKKWQRTVAFKYSTMPLSSKGSILNRVGGRFNYGRIDERRFRPFPALYVASDRLTALAEQLGDTGAAAGLSQLEVVLQDTNSVAVVSINAQLHASLDLMNEAQLQPFVNEISRFTVPPELKSWARRLGQQTPGVVSSVASLREVLLKSDWRAHPAMTGFPAGSQIFGELALSAGVEAIFYPSTKSGEECVAVFPQNFAHSESHLELDDTVPVVDPPVISRLDRTTWPSLV